MNLIKEKCFNYDLVLKLQFRSLIRKLKLTKLWYRRNTEDKILEFQLIEYFWHLFGSSAINLLFSKNIKREGHGP